MDVRARTRIVTDARTGADRLAIDGFRMTAADRVAALVARLRYPPGRFEHRTTRSLQRGLSAAGVCRGLAR